MIRTLQLLCFFGIIYFIGLFMNEIKKRRPVIDDGQTRAHFEQKKHHTHRERKREGKGKQ
jgi:hypothetical protein